MPEKYPLLPHGTFIEGESGGLLLGAEFYHPSVEFGTVREADGPKYVRDLVVTFYDVPIEPTQYPRDKRSYPGTYPASFKTAIRRAIDGQAPLPLIF